MVTAITFETAVGEKMVALVHIVLFLFEQLPKDKREKFLKEVEPFNPMGF